MLNLMLQVASTAQKTEKPLLHSLRRLDQFFREHPLTREHRVAAFARFARWQIQSRLRDETVWPWIERTRLLVRRGMTGATGNIYAGLHEWPDMAFTLHLLRPGDLFVDGGANVGSYTVLASGVRGAHTIAFEPIPTTASILRRNIEINGLGTLVEVWQSALGPAAGHIVMTAGLDTCNHVVAEQSADAITVPMERLDDVLAGRSPTLLKLDLEGYETEALRGAEQTLANRDCVAILIERPEDAAFDILRAAGFQRAAYDPFGRHVSLGDQPRVGNVLFLRNIAEVTSRVTSARPVTVLGRRI